MKVYLGVSRSTDFRNDVPGKKNFWCFRKGHDPKPGDLLLLYFPARASRVNAGISQIYQIIETSDVPDEFQCQSRGLETVQTQLALNLRTALSYKSMVTDPQLKHWNPLKRNLQGVTFIVEQEFWGAMFHLIEEADPSISKELSLLMQM